MCSDLEGGLFIDSVPARIDSITRLTSQRVNVTLSATEVITCSVVTQHQLVECMTLEANQLDLLSTHHIYNGRSINKLQNGIILLIFKT